MANSRFEIKSIEVLTSWRHNLPRFKPPLYPAAPTPMPQTLCISWR